MSDKRKLELAQKIAKSMGIEGILEISNRKNKRFKITRPDDKIIHFGQWPFRGYGTYIDHYDNSIREAWRARHGKIIKDGKPAFLNVNSPEFYSWWILW